GQGGKGGDIIAHVSNTIITTHGEAASGVLAQSDGGNGFWGGGSGLTRGGKAGSGGDAGDVSVTLGRNTTISTSGNGATAVQAVSRGGGGRNGGDGGVFWAGGKGSRGGAGGEVELTSSAVVTTKGKDAHGLYAASLGGAAGHGGSGASLVAVGG